jgi:hypothetical protein
MPEMRNLSETSPSLLKTPDQAVPPESPRALNPWLKIGSNNLLTTPKKSPPEMRMSKKKKKNNTLKSTDT